MHCVVTSPPYYGLRRYDEGVEIWGGDEGCPHEWGEELPGDNRGGSGTPTDKNNRGEGYARAEPKGCICRLCGAWRGQLGGEPSPTLYIQHLIEIMREVRRVLRPDGVFFLNIGDSWSANRSYPVQQTKWEGMSGQDGMPSHVPDGCKPLDMVLVPEQLALAARADGWYVRSILIWAKGVSGGAHADYRDLVSAWALGKQITGGDEAVQELIDRLSELDYNGNPMPESVNGTRYEKCRVKVGGGTRGVEAWRVESMPERPQQDHNGKDFLPSSEWVDCPGCEKCNPHGGYVLRKGSWRPTDSYEQVLMLTKTDSYYCDREAVLEQAVYAAGEKRYAGSHHKSLGSGSRATAGLHNKDWNGVGTRNLRSVLTIPTTSFSGEHFAVFPPRLVEPLVKAATSEKGCCSRCGSPWARVIGSKTTEFCGGSGRAGRTADEVNSAGKWAGTQHGMNIKLGPVVSSKTVGWLPTCSCDAGEPVPCRILDPFSGAGTTALVCERLGLDSISMDTSQKYIELAEARLQEDEDKRVQEQVKQIMREAGVRAPNHRKEAS